MSTKLHPDPLLGEGTENILPDWNADLPADPEYVVRAWVDKNDVRGVAVDLNQWRDPDSIVPPEEIPVEDPPEPEGDWIGGRLSSEHPNLPHSRYRSPDLTFTDPPELEEPDEAYDEIREGLRSQVNEPTES